ncbi:MAG: hypothetical protein ABI409_08520 [Ramlibacter sp.]
MVLELVLVVSTLALSLALRPWRLLAGGRLLTPLLATLVLLPWLWALPALQAAPLQLQWSGACLVLLMLGWPLAIPVLCLTALLAAWIAPVGASQALGMAAWLGVVPATLALGLGAVLRQLLGTHPFIYVLGRAFLGSALCLFAAGLLRQWTGHALPGVASELTMVARWLMAWGDAVVTGMLTAIFVAYRPQWLATWSDALYLRR